MHQWTTALAARAASVSFEFLPGEVRELARQCILDFLAVSIAGAREPLINLLVADGADNAPGALVSLIGREERSSVYQGALLNGAIAHALDFDDVNMALIGHPSAAILPGLLALGEMKGANGQDLLAAFVAGYETACGIGAVLAKSHYARGFHCTATIGTFGAAAGCAHLLKLDGESTATALGIAGTQAAGLKVMFGSMCKPLHAGKASQSGLMAASLAGRGFTSRQDILEADKGFAATHSDAVDWGEVEVRNDKFHILDNLFKYHAACYNTHAAMEAVRKLIPEMGFPLRGVRRITVRADDSLDKVCNIAEPKSGLEAKFSLRFAVALTMAGVDTARIDTFSDSNAGDPGLIAIRDKVRVELRPMPSTNVAEVEIEGMNGSRIGCTHDAGIPSRDLQAQKSKLLSKFHSLVDPVLGDEAAGRLVSIVENLESTTSVAALVRGATLISSTSAFGGNGIGQD